MALRLSRSYLLASLALVFTLGLSFASVELPYLVDEVLIGAVQTPDIDTNTGEGSRLKTELFVSHYHLRAIGYTCFGAILVLIGVGFATRRSGLAVLGAVGFMLPVFAQFAGVMFFLAGLGLLNVVWLPVLDVSFALSGLGEVIRAPYDVLRWFLGLFGVDGYWPVVYLFIGSGLLTFFFGTLAWLQARSREEGVAVSWVYRISRHPQYLGWIVWSYGVYLLLLQLRYPKRSWGISGSLPWLLSTMVIIGVAMMEEMSMQRRHGETYESYRRSAPFLFPVPEFIERLFALPFRIFFGTWRPERIREVMVVLGFYTMVLTGASFLLYGNGLERIAAAVGSDEAKQERLASVVREIRVEENRRRQSALVGSLGSFGPAGHGFLVELLRDEDPELREYAAVTLRDFPSETAFEGLVVATGDPSEDVRWHATEALGALSGSEVNGPLLSVLGDSVPHIRYAALRSLAARGIAEVMPVAMELTRSDGARDRAEGVMALGMLGMPEGLPAVTRCVSDEHSWVREEAVIAVLRIGSKEAVPALEEALDDENREVRLYAAEVLKRLR